MENSSYAVLAVRISRIDTNFCADTNPLSPTEAHQVQELIDDARFFVHLQTLHLLDKKKCRDYFEYLIRVEKQGRGQKHTVKTKDIIITCYHCCY